MHPFFNIARVEARKILQRLDARFDPRVYAAVFGIKEAGNESCGSCTDDSPFPASVIATVPGRAAALAASDPESASFQTDRRLQEQKVRHIRNRAWRRALSEAVSAHSANSGYVAYCGWPVEVDGNFVLLIVQVQKDVHDSHYHLTNASYRDRGGCHEYRLNRSLIEAVIVEYLIATSTALRGEEPGAGSCNIEDVDYLFLSASRDLMLVPAVAGGNEFGRHGVFDACNTISTLKYEGEVGVGRLVFARKGHPDVQTAVALKSPVPLRSAGAVRKLLQMATKDLALLCDSDDVYGLGSIRPTYALTGEDRFTVQFTKQFVWDLLHGTNSLMHVRHGQSSSRPPGFPDARVQTDFPRVFKGIREEDAHRLLGIAKSAGNQTHGCMLVISSQAKDEATRLKAQATLVEPFIMTDSVMDLVTTIDGSVLIDPQGMCHAIGVILDGLAAPECSPERGSRYNSAVRYHANHKEAMIVVKSEDGMVSIFPTLRPQVRRSEIRKKLAALKAAVMKEAVQPDDLFELTRWLEQHAFYLSEAECAEANNSQETARKKFAENPWYINIEATLAPHPDMNASYYLPE